MKWADFEVAAGELAMLAAEAFNEDHLAILGTNSRSGWPRISPCEVYFVHGEMMLGMMRDSRKSRDLMRDPRITVVNGQEHREPRLGDVKLYGRAVEVTDPRLRERYGETIFAAIGWRPVEPYPLFAVDIERASYISFGERRKLLRWSPDQGLQELRHPEADGDAAQVTEKEEAPG